MSFDLDEMADEMLRHSIDKLSDACYMRSSNLCLV